MYEAHGCDARATLTFGMPVKKVFTANLLEEEQEQLALDGGIVSVLFTPFEIVTLRVVV